MHASAPFALVAGLACVVALATPAAPVAAAEDDSPTITRERGAWRYDDPTAQGPTRTVSGDLVTWVVEGASTSEQTGYAVRDEDGDLSPLELEEPLPDKVTSGTVVAEVTGSGEVASAVVESTVSAASTSGHRAYVALVTNRGTKPDQSEVLEVLDTALARMVTETDGVISSFTVASVGEFAASNTSCTATNDPWQVWDDAASALYPSVSFGTGTGNHLIVVQPDGCGGGVGTVGSGVTDGGALSLDWNTLVAYTTVLHELGHNLGLYHAHADHCASTCGEYGDWYTPMGVSVLFDPPFVPSAFDSFERSRLGVTQTCEVPTVALTSGEQQRTATFDLFGRGTDAGTRGVRVTTATGAVYMLDWRNAAGRDASSFYAWRQLHPGTNQYNTGLTVQRVASDRLSSTLLSRLKPSGSGYLFAREAGESFDASGLTVSVTGTAGSGSANTAQVSIGLTDGSAAGASLSTLTGSVAMQGSATAGTTLRAVTSGWASGSCFRYQWYDGTVAIPGARSADYTVPASLAGHSLGVRVVAQRTGWLPGTAAAGAAGDWTDSTLQQTSTPTTGTTPTGTTPAPTTGTTPAPTTGTTTTDTSTGTSTGTSTRPPRPVLRGRPRVGRVLRLDLRKARWEAASAQIRVHWRAGSRRVAGNRTSLRIRRQHRGTRIRAVVRYRLPGQRAVTLRTRAKRVR